MCKCKLYPTMFTALLGMMVLLAACAPLPALDATTIRQIQQNIAARQAVHPPVNRTTSATNASLPFAAGISDAVSKQQVVLFTIEPLVASCCPSPTPDKALAAAQSVLGVLAAELIDDATVKVHFDAAQTDPKAIASAINHASFLVTVKAADANAKTVVTNANGADHQ